MTISYEKVKNEFLQKGFILKSETYINREEKLNCFCPKGHQIEISRSSFLKNSSCIYCTGKKNHPEDVRKHFLSEGYILLEKYINSSEPIKFLCPNKHEHQITYKSFKKGRRCKKCYDQIRNKNKTIPHDNVVRIFKAENCILLEKVYKNSNAKMKYVCSCKKISSIRLKDFKRGVRCFSCGKAKVSESKMGDKNPSWKGGVQELYEHLRSLTNEWKIEILKNNSFLCDISKENNGDLEVHHLIPFNQIVSETLKELNLPVLKTISDYEFEDLKNIEKEILRKHTTDIGIPLKKDIHKNFHSIYGYYEFNQKDYKNFKILYKNVY